MEKLLKPKTIRERIEQYRKNKDVAINSAISIYNASVEMIQERCSHLELKIIPGKDYYSCADCQKHFPEKKCPHKETEYHPDPSGNNDSFYECKECGQEVIKPKLNMNDWYPKSGVYIHGLMPPDKDFNSGNLMPPAPKPGPENVWINEATQNPIPKSKGE